MYERLSCIGLSSCCSRTSQSQYYRIQWSELYKDFVVNTLLYMSYMPHREKVLGLGLKKFLYLTKFLDTLSLYMRSV